MRLSRRPSLTKIAGASGLAVGLAVGGYGVASAATGGGSTSTTKPAAANPAAPRPARDGGQLTAAAKAIGISTEQLRTELQGGKSIAEVAKAHNVDVNKVIDAMVADAQSHLKDRITDEVNRPWKQGHAGPEGGHPGMGPGGILGGLRADIHAAVDAIGIPQADIMSGLRNGQSLAQIAQAHGKTPNDVISALVAAASNKIDAAVAAGHLTQAQADAMKSKLTDRITAVVNQAPPAGLFGGHGHAGHGDADGPDGSANPGGTASNGGSGPATGSSTTPSAAGTPTA